MDEKLREIKLTEKEYANLMAFLMRVDLKGSEVQAFIEVITAINK